MHVNKGDEKEKSLGEPSGQTLPKDFLVEYINISVSILFFKKKSMTNNLKMG